MRLVVQRVKYASVKVDGEVKGKIDKGFMVLFGVKQGDTEKDLEYCAKKLVGLRVFEDENQKMNLSITNFGLKIVLKPLKLLWKIRKIQ